MKKRIYYLLGLLAILASLYTALSNNWITRQTTTFYSPMILPQEVLKGDVVYYTKDRAIVIQNDARLDSIEYDDYSVTLHTTRHINLLQYIMKAGE